MSLNGIISGGLSAILTNSAALRTTSDNIANVNTAGYHRRVVQQQTLAPGGQLAGVAIADIQRIVDNILDKQALDAGSSSSRYDAQSSVMSQLDAFLGQPGDGNSIGSRIDALYGALGQASLDPSSYASRQGALSQFSTLAQSVSGLADAIAGLRQDVDQQVASTATQANGIIKQIYAINLQIQQAFTAGDTSSGLLDQRDQLVQQLSQIVGVRTNTQSDGRMFVATADGMTLVGDMYAQLSYQPNGGPAFNPITVQMVQPSTGAAVGTPEAFDAHTASGQLRGLLDMRDGTLVDIGEELGSLAQAMAQAFNAQHNANAAVPPPATLAGRNTGLLASDALNFSGATTIGVANADGDLVHKITVDFDAGTLSVDGGPASSIGTSVGSFAGALDAALGPDGSAGFTNGMLTLSAGGGNGLVIADDASNPSARGGTGFSQFFGLNDIFHSAASSLTATGLAAGDLAGFVAGGAIKLVLKGPNGERLNETTVAAAGTTIGDMVAALNSAFGSNANFTLDADGRLNMTTAANLQGYNLEVESDTTARGTTGETFTQLFGLGTGQALARAQSFAVTSAIAGAPQRLAFAQTSLDSSTALGTQIVTNGDNRGILALQAIGDSQLSFTGAGSLASRAVTLSDYAASFYQDVASRGSTVADMQKTGTTALQQAEQRQGSVEGVNLDEELENMMTFQRAYSAGARLLQTTQQLFDALLQAVGN